MTIVAHVSDWHATTLEGASLRELATKRFFGWLSWRRKRRFVHRRSALDTVLADVREGGHDAVIVTGDLTNVALPQEFEEATASLRSLGAPDHVFVVPGNHDAYVPLHASEGWDRWAPYLRSDPSTGGAVAEPVRGASSAPSFDEYPTLRVRGSAALIGLCSALPTGLFQASGRLGATQISRLRKILREQKEQGRARLVMIHHPVNAGVVSRRRSLLDAEALRAVIREVGAELIVHGHVHRAVLNELPAPEGTVPVVGVRSTSDSSARPHRRAQYHRFHLERTSGDAASSRFRIELEVRALGSSGAVETVERRVIANGAVDPR